jgi:hypothetical protein
VRSSWWRRSSSLGPASSAGLPNRLLIASTGLTMKKKTAAAIETKLIAEVMNAPFEKAGHARYPFLKSQGSTALGFFLTVAAR